MGEVENDVPLHVVTPYVPSHALSQLSGKEVYLKLDALQQSGSFKDRGMLRLCQEYRKKGITRLVSSSGGNAGLAVALSGRLLGMEAHVVVPQSTKPVMVEKIRGQGATCEVFGANWNEADVRARRLAEEGSTGYCHPFDHPTLWSGHSSLVDEIRSQGPKPDAIVLVVGGGGLMNGVLEGLERNGWGDVAVVAVEAEGAESFHEAFKAGEPRRLDAITTICTSMGALQVSDQCLPRAAAHGNVKSVVVSDRQAVQGMFGFAGDHRYARPHLFFFPLRLF